MVSVQIKNFACGDDFDVDYDILNIPTGATLADAWLTIKDRQSDADADALVRKHITPAFVAGQGQITDVGTGGTGHVYFALTGADTALCPPPIKRLEIRVRTSTGKLATPVEGTIAGTPPILQTPS